MCTAVCCSALQCVAERGSVLQRVLQCVLQRVAERENLKGPVRRMSQET